MQLKMLCPVLLGCSLFPGPPQLAGARCGRADGKQILQGGGVLGSVDRDSTAREFLVCPWQVGQREEEGEQRGGWCSEISSLLVWQLQESFIL